MTPEEIIQTVWTLKQKILGSSVRLFLTGSRAEGTNSPTADFDFVLFSPHPLSKEKFLKFRSQVSSLPTLHGIDILDLDRLDESFKKTVSSKMKEILDGQIK